MASCCMVSEMFPGFWDPLVKVMSVSFALGPLFWIFSTSWPFVGGSAPAPCTRSVFSVPCTGAPSLASCMGQHPWCPVLGRRCCYLLEIYLQTEEAHLHIGHAGPPETV